MQKVKIGILTLSDRASAGVYKDEATAQVQAVLESYIKNELEICPHSDFVSSNGRNSCKFAYSEFARSAKGDKRVFRADFPRRALLLGLNRRGFYRAK